MKRISLILALALIAIMAIAGITSAAQVKTTLPDGTNSYLSTAKKVYDDATGYKSASAFTADDKANYPNEIYLPNETHPESYRIHSNYSKNTDACASCHATHTAVGASLLQWYSVYDTCMACHDGTVTTTYNVKGGTIGASDKPAFGGMFGTGSEEALSNHNVSGAMAIAAAPGGSTVGESVYLAKDGATTAQRWEGEFGCESCHTPHGQGGNARILNPDPNFAATKNKKSGVALTQIDSTTYAVYPGGDTNKTPYTWINGYPYSKTTAVYVATVKQNNGYTIDNSNGYSLIKFTSAPAGAVTADFYPSVKVTMTVADYLQSTETVTHKSGMNNFCGACHTDYNTENYDGNGAVNGSAETMTGTYSEAYRHQVGFDYSYGASKLAAANMVLENGKMECLTCHVAHGTSQDYWKRTVGTTGSYAKSYITNDTQLVEIAGSSALKRLPNMGTCELCHAKGTGNEGYVANTGLTGYTQDDTSVETAKPNTYNFDARTADYAAADKGWVGSAKCEPCHKEYFEGWQESKHSTSNHTGATSCGRCHNPGNSIIGTGTFAAGQLDAGITCEACHGSAANHIKAPSSRNIFNPGKTSIKRQAIECGRCHDHYNNNNTGDGTINNLATNSGLSWATITKKKTSEIETWPNWSPAFRVAGEDPAMFAIATQLNTTSSHYGGAWGYADSKHYLGGGTAANPSGIVSCNTCHNMHSDKNPGLLKLDYNQVCSSCHDVGANLAQAVAMPTNSWNRHQLEGTDNAHSFKFGSPATIAAATLTVVNIEQAVSGQTPEVNSFKNEYVGTDQTTKNGSLYPGASGRTGGIGVKLAVFSDAGKTTQVFNNYDGTWQLIAHPPAVTEGDDMGVGGNHIEFIATAGLIEFNSNYYNSSDLVGTYTLKWTSKANPALTQTVSFTVTE